MVFFSVASPPAKLSKETWCWNLLFWGLAEGFIAEVLFVGNASEVGGEKGKQI